jgi:hypothetical protein
MKKTGKKTVVHCPPVVVQEENKDWMTVRHHDALFGIILLLVAISLYIHDPAESAWYMWLFIALIQFLFVLLPPLAPIRIAIWILWFITVIYLLWKM